MHLARADLRGNVLLAHILEKAQVEDLAFPRPQGTEELQNDLAIKQVVVVGILTGGLPTARGVERVGPVGIVRLQGLDHRVGRGMQVLSDLRDLRRTPVSLHQFLVGSIYRRSHVLCPTWDMDTPGVVAKVAS